MTWFQLLLREGALLLLFAALGSGIAARVRTVPDVTAQLALAPVFGLAVAACALVSATYVMPMRLAAWVVLLPLTVLSLGFAIQSIRKQPTQFRPQALHLVQLGAVLVVLGFAFTYPLAHKDSLGPMAYLVGDAAGYVAEIDGYRYQAVNDPSWGAGDWDLQSQYAAGGAFGFQQIGFDVVAAAATELFGWRAIDVQSAFMICLILVGALGSFGVIRGLARRRVWYATVAGLLYGGPLMYQLFIDGSQAAISALPLIAPIALFAIAVVRERRMVDIVLLGVLLAGLDTLYPLFMPPVALSALAIAALLLALKLAQRQLTGQVLVRGLGVFAALGGLAVAFSPLAFARSVRYWLEIAKGEYLTGLGLPQYDLPIPVLPSWLLQTREFFDLSHVTDTDLTQWFLGDLVPFLLIVLIIIAIVRAPFAWVAAVVTPAVGFLAWRAVAGYDCTYCEQRNLLVLGPVLVLLVVLGIAVIGRGRNWQSIVCAAGISLVVLVLAGQKDSVIAQRAITDAYVLPQQVNRVLDGLDGKREPVFLEGIGQTFYAPFEAGSLYNAVRQSTDQRLALDTEHHDYQGFVYLRGFGPAGPKYTPEYRWVFTRLGGIRTSRRLVKREGPFEVQQRIGPFDVTVANGVATDKPEREPLGRAWVQGTLGFWVTADQPRKLWLKLGLKLKGPEKPRLHVPSGGRLSRQGNTVAVCVPVKGRERLRRVTVGLGYKAPPPLSIGKPLYVRGRPPESVQLVSMTASPHSCMS